MELLRLVCKLSLLLFLASGQIRILSPDYLRDAFDSGNINGATASFGAPYFGQRIVGRLVYGESLLGLDHCSSDDYEAPLAPRTGQLRESSSFGQEMVNVMLVHRGQCTFVTKAKVAEEKHAKAVIVVDSRSSNKTAEEIRHAVMADDGNGDDVKIPSMLISSADGQKLINAARKEGVILEMKWDIPQAAVVLVDLWMSSGAGESKEFLGHFKNCAETLKYHLQFVPHYHIFSLPAGSGDGNRQLCVDDTFKYCAPDPDGPGPVTGADVAYEDLRQLCVWHITAKWNPDSPGGAVYSQEFWNYVAMLPEKCPIKAEKADERFGEKCSIDLIKGLGISVEDVQSCVKQNGNKYLEDEVRNMAWSEQALRLNGWRYRGPLETETVLKAICAGYTDPPAECAKLLELVGSHSINSAIMTFPGLAVMLAVIILLVAVAFHYYRNQMTKSVRTVIREEVMQEVQLQMSDYAPLQDKQSIGRTLSF